MKTTEIFYTFRDQGWSESECFHILCSFIDEHNQGKNLLNFLEFTTQNEETEETND